MLQFHFDSSTNGKKLLISFSFPRRSIHSWCSKYSLRNVEKNLYDSANIYLFKVINRNTGKIYQIWRKFAIKIPKRRHWLGMEVTFSKVSYLKLYSKAKERKLHWSVKMIISSSKFTWVTFPKKEYKSNSQL